MERYDMTYLQDPAAQYKYVQERLDFRGALMNIPCKTPEMATTIREIDHDIATFARRYPEFLAPCFVTTANEDGSTRSYAFPANQAMTAAVHSIVAWDNQTKRANG
jgi:hypothetical protein